MAIFRQNFDFGPKFDNFWIESQFLTEIASFEQNDDFWTEFPSLTKISILIKMPIGEQNLHFWIEF